MKKILIILIALMTVNVNCLQAKWLTDNQYKFKINVPENWSNSSYMDGTDKVYDFYSPDENAAIQLRTFEATAGVTLDILTQVYEQNMLPAGTQKLSFNDHTSANGIPGKQGVYQMQYKGNQVNLAAFYTIQNSKGYVLTAIIPSSMLAQKGEEVKRITRSFQILGFRGEAKKNTIASEKNTSSASDASKTSGTNDIASTYNLPTGKTWADGYWPNGIYICTDRKWLGTVIINGSSVSWTGDTYYTKPKNRMPKGAAIFDLNDFTPAYETKVRLKAKHRFRDGSGEYVIQFVLPCPQRDRVGIDVFTPYTGWIHGVQCHKK